MCNFAYILAYMGFSVYIIMHGSLHIMQYTLLVMLAARMTLAMLGAVCVAVALVI